MSERWDAVVVGAGHNGLATAALLAKRGRKVLVVERREVAGGLAAGEEFWPGYRSVGVLHDSSAVRAWLVESLKLGRHGLEWAEEQGVFAPQRDGDGPGLICWRSPEKSRDEIARHSPRDAESYAAYRAFLDGLAPFLRRTLDRVPPDPCGRAPGDLWALARTALGLRRLGRERMTELLRIAPMCAADWLSEWFESDLLKALLAAPAVHHTFTGPWSSGSNANLLLAECLAGREVRGGPAAFAASLERAALTQGAQVRTGTAVERLLLEGRRVVGVALAGGEEVRARRVAAACSPKHLFLDLVPPELVPGRLEQHLRHFRTRGTTAKVHLALSRYPRWDCRRGIEPQHVRIGDGLDALERAFDPVKYRRLPERPVLDVHVPTVTAPELAPEGHHVLSIAVHFVPYDLEGGWNPERSEELYRTVLATLATYAPGLPGAVVGREVLSPADLERRYGVSGGHLLHGEPALDQLLVRPTPECARYATPFEGLFLCGGGSHPGGGIHGAPGALAARVLLRA